MLPLSRPFASSLDRCRLDKEYLRSAMEKAIAYLDTGEMPSLWEADTILLSEDDEDEDHEVTSLELVHRV